MDFRGFTCIINAHGRSQITKLIRSAVKEDEIISIGNDGYIKIWNPQTLCLINQKKIGSAYLTSLLSYNKGYLIGNGKGQLIKLNFILEIESKFSIHIDCISHILSVENYIITISYDGWINFLQKQTFEVEKKIQLNTPLISCLQSDNKLYIASNPSYCIDIITFQITQMQRFDQFAVFNETIYGCSYEKGLINPLVDQTNCCLPCQFILVHEKSLLAICEQCISFVQQGEDLTYRSYHVKQLLPGYSIKTGLCIENCIVLGGQDGNIYQFYHEELKNG